MRSGIMTIDLRSDTVTLPTEEMRNAMANAELGDDVFGEDPTVNKLERCAADLLGKEAAVLVTSGTQANLVSLLALTKPGDEVIVEKDAHIYYYEQGGLCRIAGLAPRLISTPSGAISPTQLKAALRPENAHYPRTSLVCLENTHNRHGGAVLTQEEMENLSEMAHSLGLKVHLDGARIFNAAVALHVPARDLVTKMDTVAFCLSKGLSAPIGSLVVADRTTIELARRARKLLGGGMRQAGIIAAPGLVALEKMIDRLAEDHEHAAELVQCLLKIPGVKVQTPPNGLITNIVLFDVGQVPATAPMVVRKLGQRGILSMARSETEIRLVTHYGIDDSQIDIVVAALREILM